MELSQCRYSAVLGQKYYQLRLETVSRWHRYWGELRSGDIIVTSLPELTCPRTDQIISSCCHLDTDLCLHSNDAGAVQTFTIQDAVFRVVQYAWVHLHQTRKKYLSAPAHAFRYLPTNCIIYLWRQWAKKTCYYCWSNYLLFNECKWMSEWTREMILLSLSRDHSLTLEFDLYNQFCQLSSFNQRKSQHQTPVSSFTHAATKKQRMLKCLIEQLYPRNVSTGLVPAASLHYHIDWPWVSPGLTLGLGQTLLTLLTLMFTTDQHSQLSWRKQWYNNSKTHRETDSGKIVSKIPVSNVTLTFQMLVESGMVLLYLVCCVKRFSVDHQILLM